jgi:hypothetical protein
VKDRNSIQPLLNVSVSSGEAVTEMFLRVALLPFEVIFIFHCCDPPAVFDRWKQRQVAANQVTQVTLPVDAASQAQSFLFSAKSCFLHNECKSLIIP